MPYSTMVDCMWKLKIINSCILNYYLCFCGLGLFETKPIPYLAKFIFCLNLFFTFVSHYKQNLYDRPNN